MGFLNSLSSLGIKFFLNAMELIFLNGMQMNINILIQNNMNSLLMAWGINIAIFMNALCLPCHVSNY